MHGILGSKANWATPAKKVVERHPGWSVLLLDHRAHGQSPAGTGEHTVEACAADVFETLDALGVRPDGRQVVCGHSFGGKVSLAYAQLCMQRGLPPPATTWIFDSVPGNPAHAPAAPTEDAWDALADSGRAEQSVPFVLRAVTRAAARGYESRKALVTSLQEEHGLVPAVAQWIAQSTRPAEPSGVELCYDMAAVKAMYDSYARSCYWHVLEGSDATVGAVVAGRNEGAWGSEQLARLRAAAAESGGRVCTHTLDAGHNVHVDALGALLDTIAPTFEDE